MSNYVLETPDEFATRRNNENINNFNDGYETALLDILEMIETDASYDEVYESIEEYLVELNRMTKVALKDFGGSKLQQMQTKHVLGNLRKKVGSAAAITNHMRKNKYMSNNVWNDTSKNTRDPFKIANKRIDNIYDK